MHRHSHITKFIQTIVIVILLLYCNNNNCYCKFFINFTINVINKNTIKKVKYYVMQSENFPMYIKFQIRFRFCILLL